MNANVKRQVAARWLLCWFATGMLAAGGCTDTSSTSPTTVTPLFQKTVLVADSAGLGTTNLDPNLLNPWGIAIHPTNGRVWVADNHSGVSTVYDAAGVQQTATLPRIPTHDGSFGGGPTGIVFNTTPDFVIPGQGAAIYIFATEDGTISAWNASTTDAVLVANRSADSAVYLGIALASGSGGGVLFAANFRSGRVDMFDKNFAYVKSFTDPGIPSDYGPFNVQVIGGNLYLAYAKHDPATGEEAAGAGNGYVSLFGTDGTLIRRVASNGTLNAPWGMAMAPTSFGSYSGDILVGNFGDGRISVFNPTTGVYLGQLKGTDSAEISIDGLWGLATGPNNSLYFAAGPDDERHGVLGILSLQQ
jgi:uncharacterized protein (TIGR03118 family)